MRRSRNRVNGNRLDPELYLSCRRTTQHQHAATMTRLVNKQVDQVDLTLLSTV